MDVIFYPAILVSIAALIKLMPQEKYSSAVKVTAYRAKDKRKCSPPWNEGALRLKNGVGSVYSSMLAVWTASAPRQRPRGWSRLWSRGSQALCTNMRH